MNKQIDFKTVQLDGVSTADYPDFVDAFIAYAEYEDGTEVEVEKLEELTEDRDLVMNLVYDKLF